MVLDTIKNFVHAHKKQLIILGLIVILASVLRFYNFSDRWGIGNDDARDVAIAYEALERRELPMIGSFSSAGPFVFGPLFYWFIMVSLILFNGLVFGPWIVMGLVGVTTVIIFYFIGRELAGDRLGYIAAFLTAVSPQLSFRSLLLGQHTLVSITSALMVLFFIRFWKTKNNWYMFGLGCSLGTALSMHYQSLNLLLFFFLILLIPQKTLIDRIKSLIFMIVGFVIPSLPLLIWDAQQNFANMTNILDYFLVGQHRLYVPNSWKLFLFEYFPSYWAFVVGGFKYVGLLLMVIVGVTVLWNIYKRQLPGVLFVLGIGFAILFYVNRFYKGERSEGYLIYFTPFIIVFTSWTVHWITQKLQQRMSKSKKKNQYVRNLSLFSLITILGIICTLNFIISYPLYSATGRTAQFYQIADHLISKYPKQKFAVHDYTYGYSYHSQPLGLILELKGKADKKGMPIGFICKQNEFAAPCTNLPIIYSKLGGVVLVDLRKEKNMTKWVGTNQDDMYDDLIGWSKRHELKSTFSLTDYLFHRK